MLEGGVGHGVVSKMHMNDKICNALKPNDNVHDAVLSNELVNIKLIKRVIKKKKIPVAFKATKGKGEKNHNSGSKSTQTR